MRLQAGATGAGPDSVTGGGIQKSRPPMPTAKGVIGVEVPRGAAINRRLGPATVPIAGTEMASFAAAGGRGRRARGQPGKRWRAFASSRPMASLHSVVACRRDPVQGTAGIHGDKKRAAHPCAAGIADPCAIPWERRLVSFVRGHNPYNYAVGGFFSDRRLTHA